MKKPASVVLDTSALIDAMDDAHPAWGEALRHLRGEYQVRAPAFLASEAGNVVHCKSPGAFGRDAAERSRLLEVMLDGIERVPSEEASRARAGALAEETGLSFYDAEFLELAVRDRGSVLVTQDRRLLTLARPRLGPRRALDLTEVGAAMAQGAL